MAKKLLFIVTGLCLVVFTAGLLKGFLFVRNDPKTKDDYSRLVVYASSSFIDPYGPGADLKAEFEKKCSCHVEYVDAGGGPAVIERMKLLKETRVDVILGMDLLLLHRAAIALPWKDLEYQPSGDLFPEIKQFRFSTFIPYDWSPVAILYNNKKTKPVSSWTEAIQTWSEKSLSIPDPTLSTLGLSFLFWADYSFRKSGLQFKDLVPKIHSQTGGWSQSYGLFRQGQLDIALSYVSSLVYHQVVEKDSSVSAMVFSEGHPMQIEFAAVPKQCVTCTYAVEFALFLQSEVAQKIIMEKNFMYPVRQALIKGTVYETLPKVQTIPLENMDDFIRHGDEVQKMWSEFTQNK